VTVHGHVNLSIPIGYASGRTRHNDLGGRDMIEIDGGSAQQGANQLAFLRYVSKRILAVEQRVQRYSRDGWEVGAIAALSDEVLRLADASRRYDLLESSRNLLMLEQILRWHLVSASVPEPQEGGRMLALIAAVTATLAIDTDSPQLSAQADIAQETGRRGELRDVPNAALKPEPIVVSIAADAALTGEAVNPDASAARRIFYLNDGNALALELAQRLGVDGYEVESVATVDELSELLTYISPKLLVVGDSHLSELTAVGEVRRDAQQRSQHRERIQMVAMAPQDSLQLRLGARRAGVDVLLFAPFNATDLLRQLQALLTPAVQEKVRVLIVEDDHAQAVFAQSVLANAGMQAQVEQDPLHVLESLRSLHPDLVLMDLHMPQINGLQLTALIREHPVFMHTPIVFLSGESDPAARVAAIEAGGNDFLSKPIRPKHLIAAVQNSVRVLRAP
jgi:DNA-binding response OmpR family regulator